MGQTCNNINCMVHFFYFCAQTIEKLHRCFIESKNRKNQRIKKPRIESKNQRWYTLPTGQQNNSPNKLSGKPVVQANRMN